MTGKILSPTLLSIFMKDVDSHLGMINLLSDAEAEHNQPDT